MWLYQASNNQIQKLDTFSIPNQDEVAWFYLDHSNKKQIIDQLPIHQLAKKNLLHFSEIPKVNEYENEVVLSICSITPNYETVKVNILAAKNYVITIVDEKEKKLFQPLPTLFQEDPKQMAHPGQILFHVINTATDHILTAIDEIADELLKLEKSVFKDPFENQIGKTAYRWKSRLHGLRQMIEPQEEVIKVAGKEDFPFSNDESRFYFQDLESDQSRIISALDTFKENLMSIYNLQMSLKADHTNAIMKTLTLVSVIFLPMTFLAGLYGMNFEHMPELKWRFGYGAALILMFGVGTIIAAFFRVKGWWGKNEQK